jgi:hypothetical protein
LATSGLAGSFDSAAATGNASKAANKRAMGDFMSVNLEKREQRANPRILQ